MTPSQINESIVADKTAVVRRMLEAITTLPLASRDEFLANPHNAAAAESYRERKILAPELASTLIEMAGYRNRLVHFYDEVTADELYENLTRRRHDLEKVLDAFLVWIASESPRASRDR